MLPPRRCSHTQHTHNTQHDTPGASLDFDDYVAPCGAAEAVDEAALRAGWPAPKAVDDAYEALFSAKDRREYALADFRGDLLAHRGGDAEAPLSVDDALEFLRAMA